MSDHRYSRLFPAIFLVADLTCLNLGIYLTNYIQYDRISPPEVYVTLQFFLNMIWLLVFFGLRFQEINRNSSLLYHLNEILTGLVINLSIVFALWFVLQPVDYSRKFLFITYLFFVVSIISWRSVWHYAIRYYRKKGYNSRNVLIIGSGDLSNNLQDYFGENKELGYKLVGVLDENTEKKYAIEHFCYANKIDIIFCCLPKLKETSIKEIIDFAENNLIKVNLVSQFSKLMSYNLAIQQLGDVPILSVNAIPLDYLFNRAVKRTFDIIFSSLVTISILSWLTPVIGILIKLESKGPVFFRQKRHGKGNRGFFCWKFRTMGHKKTEKFKQVKKNDPRITKVGKILRKMSIDELPQFINVFLGDMSIVGPRPHPIQLNEEFQPKIDRFWQRHAVKPGITGLAQAKGFRGGTSALSEMSGRIKLDRFYVKNWSLVLDVKIILLTILSIVKRNENAY